MSILNKLGLEKRSKYDELLNAYNVQSAHLLQIESQLIVAEERMKTMSDVPNLRNQLDYMNARYEKMKQDFAQDV